MTGFTNNVRGFFGTSWVLMRALVSNVTGHWALAIVSIIAAAAIWFVIQDVENPRVESVVPLEGASQGIPVEAVNLSPEYVVAETARVRARVEAREAEIPQLRPSDFRATIDLQGIEPGSPVSLPVEVEALDDSVQVISVEPSRISVELIRIQEEEFEVGVNVTGSLPEGFELANSPTVEPAFVTVSGRPELVENVDRVEVDVNLSGQRESFQATGELVARNRNGDAQIVTLSEPRATVSFTIEPVFAEKVLPVHARLNGTPEPGYQVTSISLSPPVVTVTGPQEILDGLDRLTVDEIALEGATSDISQSRAIQRPENVSLGRDAVNVEVDIGAIVCGGDGALQCGAALFVVAPQFEGLPEGLTIQPGAYTVAVRVSGPLTALRSLDPSTVTAFISLDGASAGTASYTPEVTVPGPLRVESVDPVSVTLAPASASP
ncbi:MAG: CdaR family protein [Dehalococcoidia bacterium]|nr:CdaR family protein [Dehalococcoidia bacterium]